jgi:hypothetical protein
MLSFPGSPRHFSAAASLMLKTTHPPHTLFTVEIRPTTIPASYILATSMAKGTRLLTTTSSLMAVRISPAKSTREIQLFS